MKCSQKSASSISTMSFSVPPGPEGGRQRRREDAPQDPLRAGRPYCRRERPVVVVVNDDDGIFVYERGLNSFAPQPSIVRIAHELGIEPAMGVLRRRAPPPPKGTGQEGRSGAVCIDIALMGLMHAC